MGPLYKRDDLRDEYWVCKRALMCSTGAAMKETVAPAITPATAWPIVGNLCGGGKGDADAKDDGESNIREGEKSVRCSRLR